MTEALKQRSMKLFQLELAVSRLQASPKSVAARLHHARQFFKEFAEETFTIMTWDRLEDTTWELRNQELAGAGEAIGSSQAATLDRAHQDWLHATDPRQCAQTWGCWDHSL